MRSKSESEIVAVALLVAVVAAWSFGVVVTGSAGLGLGVRVAPENVPAVTAATPSSVGLPFGGPPTCTDHVTAENHDDDAIQDTIDGAAPGSTICIGAGTFPEQLRISTPGLTLLGAGNGSTFIEPSAPLTVNTLDFDSASTYAALTPAVAIVLVENTTNVTIEDLTVSGANAASTFTGCGVDYYGVDFQNSSGTLTGATVTDIELPPAFFGCQPGLGVYAYNGYFLTGTAPSPAVAVTVSASTITNYDKGGIVCDDLGESCSIVANTVTGVGANTSIAQNGIQVGYGASATVSDNAVSGNHYTNYFPDDIDYFAPYVQSTGILVYDGGNAVQVASNALSGNDLGIAVLGTAQSTVSDNHVLQGFSYGITLDMNASIGYLYFPVYSTLTPWLTTASGNSISNVNVGLLVYDDNATISGGSMSNVNVSVESVLDQAGPSYAITLDSVSAQANVDGALLGNISSFQSTPGMQPLDTGTYTLTADHFTAGPTPPPAGDLSGIVLNATSATVSHVTVSGFDIGLFLNPAVATATIEQSTVTVPASLGEPGVGIWAGNLAPNPVTETAGAYTIDGNTVTGPGGAADSPLAGGTGIIAGGASLSVTDNVVSDFSAVLGSTPTNLTGPGSGYDWWQGTQSVGVLLACAPSTPATSCLLERNTIDHNAIGVAVILSNSAFAGTWQTGPVTIALNTIDASGGYGIYTAMGGQGGGVPQTSYIDNNTIDDTLTGAPALYLAGQVYEVDNNVLIGTSTSGNQGPVQGEGGPSINTSTVEATDYWTYPYDWTTVTLNANLFLDTDVYWSTSFAPGSSSSLSSGEFVNFTESGLPVSTPWAVDLDGTVASVAAPTTIVGQLQNGSFPYSVGNVPGYIASPSSGTVTVVGAPVTQNVVFGLVHYGVTFSETGLPASDTWWVNISGQAPLSNPGSLPTIGDSLPNGLYSFTVASDDSSYAPSYASSTFHVSGASVTVPTVTFSPVNLTFTETGLPSGTAWSVTLDGAPGSSVTNAIVFSPVLAGPYAFTVGSVPGYSATPSSGSVTMSGVSKTVPVTFSVVTYVVTIRETGLPAGKTWTAVLGSAAVNTTASSVTFNEPNGTFPYLLKGPKNWGVLSIPPTGFATVRAGPLTIVFEFGRVVTYTLTVTERGLPAGESWCVRLGWAECTKSSRVSLGNLTPGMYPYAVLSPLAGQTIGATIGKTAYPVPTGTVWITKNTTLALTFVYDYAVTFTESGLQSGTIWSVTIASHKQSALAGGTIEFSLPNGTYAYKVGPVTGYSSAGLPKKVHVAGSAVPVAITFSPVKPPEPGLVPLTGMFARSTAGLEGVARVAGPAEVAVGAAFAVGLLGAGWVARRTGLEPGGDGSG